MTRRLLPFLLLFTSPAWAVLARDGASRTSATFGSTGNISLTTAGGGELIVALLSGGNGPALTTATVSGGGLTWTKVLEEHSLGPVWNSVWLAWASAKLTAQTITGTFSGSTGFLLTVDAFTGAQDMTGLVAGTDYATATAASAAGVSHLAASATTKAANSFVTASASYSGAIFSSVDANCTLIADSGQNGNDSLFRTDEPLAVGTYSLGVTVDRGAGDFSIAVIEILAAGGAAAATPQRSLMGVGQ